MSPEYSGPRPRGDGANEEVVPEVVEWLVGAVLAVGGMALTLGGSAVLWLSDEELIAEAVTEGFTAGTTEPIDLTPAQVTDLAVETVFWLGVGLLATGLALVLVAIAYVVLRRRARRADGPRDDTERLLSNAVLGAIATGLLSFVPVISPLLGGGVAGYVQRKQAPGVLRAGGLSGLLAAVPLIVILLFLAVGLATGFASAGAGGLGLVVALAVVIAALLTLIYSGGLGALGAYIADVVAEDDEPPTDGIDSTDDADTTDAVHAPNDDEMTNADETTS